MSEFLQAVVQHAVVRNAVLAGLLASVACGIVGTYVAVRRIGYIAGSIAHCVLGGLGAALYLNRAHGWTWLQPLHGAIVAALGAAVIIAFVGIRAREREDTTIGALWALGMAIGVMCIRKTPGYEEDLMSYLFANIVMVPGRELWLILALDFVVVGAAVLFHDELLALCFDAEFAQLRGVRVQAYYVLLLCLTALTVVLLVTVVGVVLVIALLTLPIALASHFARTLRQTMILAAALSMAFSVGGLALSYGPHLPAGATIVLLAGSAYIVVVGASWVRARVNRARLQAATENGESA